MKYKNKGVKRMKILKGYDLAIGMNDYKVRMAVTDNYDVIKVVAEEDIKESKKHTYKVGEEIKLSKRDMDFISENLKEEFIPFKDDDDLEI